MLFLTEISFCFAKTFYYINSQQRVKLKFYIDFYISLRDRRNGILLSLKIQKIINIKCLLLIRNDKKARQKQIFRIYSLVLEASSMKRNSHPSILYRALVKFDYLFFYSFFATTTYVTGTPKNRRNETILLKPKTHI